MFGGCLWYFLCITNYVISVTNFLVCVRDGQKYGNVFLQEIYTYWGSLPD